MARTVAGIFPDRRSAEHAIVDLKAAGFDPQRMGIVMRDRSDAREVAEDQDVSTTAGAVTGGVIGGTAGALLAATGALAIPGVGPFITGGVLATLVGGAAGWLVGGLAGLGLSRDEAEYYQNRVEQGGVLVTVDPQGRDAEARRIMLDNGAEDIQLQADTRNAELSGYDTNAAGTTPAPSASGSVPLGGSAGATPDAMADTRRGMSREMLSGTMPNIPPDQTRVPRQDSASDAMVNDQSLPADEQRSMSGDRSAQGYDVSRQTVPRRPAMDEDIIQGRAHGSVGDEDVITDPRRSPRSVPNTRPVDERDQHMVDD
ncbi:MAG TPA: general stress protein [Ktedonobacterales bacterium]